MTKKIVKRGEVYWVYLPLDENDEEKEKRKSYRELQGKHPALIVSNDEQNKFSPLITILPLTSQTDKIYPFQVESNLREKKGVILVDQIRTIDKERLGERLGELDMEIMEKVERALHLTLALKS